MLQAGLHGFTYTASFIDSPVIWDTGASIGLTPFRGDFIDYEECNLIIKDISKNNTVVGIGTVMWKFTATNGDILYLPGLAYHLPTADICLLSPQAYHQMYGGESRVDGDNVLMSLPPKRGSNQRLHSINIPIEKGISNLPIVHKVSCTDDEREQVGPHLRSAQAQHTLNFKRKSNYCDDEFEYEFQAFSSICAPCLSDDSNLNLTGPQRELLLWHWKLGISMHRIQEIMKQHEAVDRDTDSVLMPQVIKPRFPSTSYCKVPLCTTCELSRAKKRNPKVIKTQAIKEREQVLAADQYEPGDFVSMDQFIVRTPGRLPSGYGREAQENRYHGGTIFNDAATGIIWAENQVSLGAGETILSKTEFEEWLWELACVEINHYRSDNGVFQAEEFKADCHDKNQKQSFSGVGAQHQNARAERAIQTIMYMARTFLLHVSLHWTEYKVDDLSLWPFAVKHAVWLYNRLPNRITGLTPLELLTKTKADHKDLLRTHVWG